MDELASVGTLEAQCVMNYKLEKNTRRVPPGNGDVPLDEVASFTTGLTISREFFTWHFLRDFKGRKIALSRDVKMVRFKCT